MFKHTLTIIVVLTNQALGQTVNYNCITSDGEQGLCKESQYCQIENYKKQTRGIEPVICGRVDEQDGDIVICCTDINTYINKEVSTVLYPGMQVNERKCLEYSGELRRLKNFNREYSVANSIHCYNDTKKCHRLLFVIGGVNADIDEFPHMVLLGWDQVNGNGYDWKCGGSLISEQYVLTAAHCLHIDDSELKTSEPTMIRLGGSFPMEIKISSIIYHPNYQPPKKYNDIGLIKLEKSIEFTEKIFPACLNGYTYLRGNATAIGWGNTSPDGDKATQLQKVTLDFYQDEECKSGYPVSRSQPDGIVESQFCAGYKPGGKDACQGDSGGPIQRYNKHNEDIFDIIGITSFGAGCGSSKGGVYTRVSHFTQWIDKIVWPGERVI